MTLTNTPAAYGSVTKTLHWLTALLILTVIPLGLIAHDLPYDTAEALTRKAWLFSLHKTIGMTVFAVALVRILWALTQTKPGLLNADNPPEALAAEIVHWMLYAALVAAPLTGWIHHAATTGFAPIWWPFGQSLPFVPKDEAIAALFGGLHWVVQWVLIGSLGLHIAGALKHHVIDRDATLRRMLPGRSNAPTPPAQHHSPVPPLIALGLYALAIGAGGVIGAYSDHQGASGPRAALEQVQSDWTVETGALEITVDLFGSPVSGAFADWTAAIAFAERDIPGPAGTVAVTVSIASLTLGSVTSEAMGEDFFAAETFPTATFQGEILRTDTGYVARGPLTIRDQMAEIELPFDLTLEDNRARMSGALHLDRRVFNIGAGQSDESSLGFSVAVAVALEATKTP